MDEHKLKSPQGMVNAACAEHFDGRMPTNFDEWVTVFNYIAFNVAYGTEELVMPMMSLIYPESGISTEIAAEIGIFQMQKKEEEQGAALKNAQDIVRRAIDDETKKSINKHAKNWKPKRKE